MSTYVFAGNQHTAITGLTAEQRIVFGWGLFASSCECDECCKWRHSYHRARDYPNGFVITAITHVVTKK